MARGGDGGGAARGLAWVGSGPPGRAGLPREKERG